MSTVYERLNGLSAVGELMIDTYSSKSKPTNCSKKLCGVKFKWRWNSLSLSRYSKSNVSGGVPRVTLSKSYTSCINCLRVSLISSSLAPRATKSRSTFASWRSFLFKYLFKSLEAELEKLSGITLFGTTPYFLNSDTIISHCPPSCWGVCKRKATLRLVTGSPAVFKIFSWK